jgi:acetylornithine aminotransferase
MNHSEIIDTADRVLATTYQRFPVVFTRGNGCTLYDENGKKYIDFVAGIAVCGLGHAHPRIARVVSEQAATLIHTSNLYYTVPQVKLAAWLTRHSFADRVFFANSGAEANEAALKLARKYFKDQTQSERFRIIAMERSFHGRTMATLSATGQEKIRKGFAPVLEGFDFVPFNDIAALQAAMGPDIAAVLMEPIQGEGGIRVPDADYLPAVRHLCDQSGALLIFDEIQTGMGRTGRLFAHEHFGITPDIITLAKALGNGLPIGAMLAKEAVASAFKPGSHASTFGGTPLVTAAALEVVRTIEEEDIIMKSVEIGDYFKKQLGIIETRHDEVMDIRGMGLLLGMKLKTDVAPVVQACLENGFLVNGIQDKILRFAPPLIVTRTEIDALINCLDEILSSRPVSRPASQ